MSPQDLTPEFKVAVRVGAELFYRSAQVKKYLDRLGPGESNQHRLLVKSFQLALEDVETASISSFEALADITPEDPSWNQAIETLHDNLRIFSRSFIDIHELLALLPRESIRPEVLFALEGCFPEFFEHQPPVVLGSIVNAFEFDFIDILKDRLPDIGAIFPEDKRIYVLQLAICDADSPHACAILCHELGHAMDVRHKISVWAVEEFMSRFGVDESLRPILLYWCRELCADLIASRVAGPVPILTILSIEYCIYPQYSIGMHSETHPSTLARLQVIEQDMDCSDDLSGFRAEIEFYKNARRLNLERICTDPNIRKETENNHRVLTELLIKQMATLVCERLSSLDLPDLKVPCRRFDQASLDRCVERLRRGTPVSSQGESPESLEEKVKQYRKRVFKSQEERIEAFKNLCDEFAEKPLEVAKILLSGYNYKLEVMNSLYEAERPLGNKESVTSFCDSLATLDLLIGSSIVTTRVHKEMLRRLEKDQST